MSEKLVDGEKLAAKVLEEYLMPTLERSGWEIQPNVAPSFAAKSLIGAGGSDLGGSYGERLMICFQKKGGRKTGLVELEGFLDLLLEEYVGWFNKNLAMLKATCSQ